MLSPKMQRIQKSIRINDDQLIAMVDKARSECVIEGPLLKRCSDSNKWLTRYFKLYQVCIAAQSLQI